MAAFLAFSLSFALTFAPASQPMSSARPQPAQTFPAHGGAFVTSLPGSASAWLDGTYIGSTPFYVDDLLPGRHSVTLSSAGWQPLTTTFDVSIGRITPVSLVMTRVGSAPGGQPNKGQGMLAVSGAPPGSKAYVDGVGIGTAPFDARAFGAGYHIVTLVPREKGAPRMTRIVDVFPNVLTAVVFAQPVTSSQSAPPADDILEPVDSVVAANAVMISGNDVIVHYHGNEIECAIGSRTYKFNGRVGTLGVPPALVGGKLYLPQSLLARLGGK